MSATQSDDSSSDKTSPRRSQSRRDSLVREDLFPLGEAISRAVQDKPNRPFRDSPIEKDPGPVGRTSRPSISVEAQSETVPEISAPSASPGPRRLRTKLTIIGGGPAGLTAAIYAGRAGLDPVLVHGGFAGQSMIPGGQLMITTDVENFPGFPDGIAGPDLMVNMQRQALRFGVREEYEFAVRLVLGKGRAPKFIELSDSVGGKEISAIIESDAVIIATGAQAVWLGAKHESRFMNRGVSACATCDGPLPRFRNGHIVVVGGGDSAFEEALFLSQFASHVTILIRGDRARASKIMQERVLKLVGQSPGAPFHGAKNSKVSIEYGTVLESYTGTEEDGLTGIRVSRKSDKALKRKNPDSDEEDTRKNVIECVGVFIAIGHTPNTDFVRRAGISMDKGGYVRIDRNVFTSAAGVFACGDVHDMHYRQAITAAGFGCMAALEAERWLSSR